MSEISREEHKKLLYKKLRVYIDEKQYQYEAPYITRADVEAILSDMEKLEKIENALGTTCLSKNNEKCDYDGDCEIHTLKVIEQIVKG